MAGTKSYDMKPWHDYDPWRFICPDCGSHNVTKLVGGQRVSGKQYSRHNPGELQQDKQKGFRCKECGQRKATVYDKKKGHERRDV